MKIVSNEKNFKESISFDTLLIKNIKIIERELKNRIKLKDEDIKIIIDFIKLKYSKNSNYNPIVSYCENKEIFLWYIFYKVLEKIKFPVGYGTVFVSDDCKAFLTHSIERIEYYRNTYGIVFNINTALPMKFVINNRSINTDSFLSLYDKSTLNDIIDTSSKLYANEFFKTYPFIIEDREKCRENGCTVDINMPVDSIVFAINMVIKYDRFIEGDANNDTCT